MATPQEALQVVLRFKYFQAELYRRVLEQYGAPGAGFEPGVRAVVTQVHKQKVAHVAQLKSALGSGAPAQPAPGTMYDMTGGGGGNAGPFLSAWNSATLVTNEFFKLAQLVEDFGIRCVKGRLPDLITQPSSVALIAQMHAVDGRHAAIVRMMRGGASRAPVTRVTTAFTTAVFPWISNTASTLYDTGATGYTGAENDTNSQAHFATLVYGVYYTGADRFTVKQDTEANQWQRGYAPVANDVCDEPLAMDGVTAVLARFNIL